MTRTNLKTLKLKLLDLIAPCRRYALFLSEKMMVNKNSSESGDLAEQREDANESAPAKQRSNNSGMGISRTVALMVLLSGDSDPDVKNKSESYLRAHMDTYRGKEVPQQQQNTTSADGDNGASAVETTTIHDALLGNSVALAQTILVLAIGGASSLSIDKSLSSQYSNNSTALDIMKTRLGLTYHYNSDSRLAQA